MRPCPPELLGEMREEALIGSNGVATGIGVSLK